MDKLCSAGVLANQLGYIFLDLFFYGIIGSLFMDDTKLLALQGVPLLKLGQHLKVGICTLKMPLPFLRLISLPHLRKCWLGN